MKLRLQAIAWICALAIGLHASPAAALSKHRLLASLPPLLGDLTLDPNDSSAEIFYENGVAGTDPNSRSLFASVDSASGVFVVNGQTNNLLLPNQSRAVARLEQLMDMDSVPTVIDAVLILDGGGLGGFIELDASLQVGECIAGLSRDVGTAEEGFVVTTNGCTDNSFVSWNAGGGDGALHVTSTWSKQPPFGEVYMAAQVSGDFGGILGDIPSGSFSNSGQLSIEISGGKVVFFSDSFLTVPEPDAAAGLVAALGAIALLARQRAKQKSGSREGGAMCPGGAGVRCSRRTVEGSTL
jgi:hypothetical protein